MFCHKYSGCNAQNKNIQIYVHKINIILIQFNLHLNTLFSIFIATYIMPILPYIINLFNEKTGLLETSDHA